MVRARHVAGVFARDTAEVRRARGLVRSALTSWGLPQQVPDFELAVSELVTNALVHGSGDVEVYLTASADIIRLDVADHGGVDSPHIEPRSANEAPGGWGLQLIDELADAWATASGPTQTRVWMERAAGRSRSDHGPS
jgi:anti-sigma regulatory factor (Ser/Thr protein kinase)